MNAFKMGFQFVMGIVGALLATLVILVLFMWSVDTLGVAWWKRMVPTLLGAGLVGILMSLRDVLRRPKPDQQIVLDKQTGKYHLTPLDKAT